MKLIFCDFDGVLNSIPYAQWISVHNPVTKYPLPSPKDPEYALAYVRREGRRLDPRCVERLGLILDRSGAKLVVSSSWRGVYPEDAGLAEILAHRGLKHPVFGETPDLSELNRSSKLYVAHTRWDEIRMYLDSVQETLEAYLILDDDAMADAPQDRFLRTSRNTGLTDADVVRSLDILAN